MRHVALASLDLLARVIAPYSAPFRGFDALAVDHPGAGAGLAAFGPAHAPVSHANPYT